MENLLYSEDEILLFTDQSTQLFKYDVVAKVSSAYDDYYPVYNHNFRLIVDPSSDLPKAVVTRDIDNGFRNCRHYHGVLHATYSRGYKLEDGTMVEPKLEFKAFWDRTCGTCGWSNIITFAGNIEVGTCQLNYNDTVRIDIKFRVL